MSIAKVIEISSTSTRSFEDAVRSGIKRCCETVDQVRGAWIKEQQVVVEGGQIVEYRVNLMVTFVVGAADRGPAAGRTGSTSTQRSPAKKAGGRGGRR